MPYCKRTVYAGSVIEHKKMMTPRLHTKGTERKPNRKKTGEAQTRVNERKAEENLRWLINTNFKAKDYHAVLHYSDKERELDACIKDLSKFLRELRSRCKKERIAWKYIIATETKRMTNIHHHIILPKMDTELIADAWGKIVKGGVSIKILDNRKNHAKLANYLIKETRSTAQRCKELGRRFKRYSCSQGLDKPIVKYTKVHAASWRREPRARKGCTLYKYDNGETARSGWHEFSGYPFQEYIEIMLQPPERGKANEHKRVG